jgi:hypothetical protein
MEYPYIEAKNPRWANEERTMIDCDVNFNHLEQEFVPFTASPTDTYGHSIEIYNRALAGDFGPIADWEPPPPHTLEQKIWLARDYRNQLLVELDGVTSNPLRWSSFSEEKKQEFAVYRQALLDVPQQATFPDPIDWPIKPY